MIDECHRGSAAEDSAWREILAYFSSATHIGLTATPKETRDVSSMHYFGDPIYSYTLKQGIEDGFLAPYKVVRIDIDKDLQGWRPSKGQTDKHGQLIEDRIYNLNDMDRTLVLEKRTELVARKITEFLAATDPYAKTIVFCDDIDHAERMRQPGTHFDEQGNPLPPLEKGGTEGGFEESIPKRVKYIMGDVTVYIVAERVQYYGPEGKLITESLKDYPPGVKSYNKTKPMKIEEFDAEAAWWGKETEGFKHREANQFTWKISLEDIQARNYNLDCKNPHITEQEIHDSNVLLAQYHAMQNDMIALRNQLKNILDAALIPKSLSPDKHPPP